MRSTLAATGTFLVLVIASHAIGAELAPHNESVAADDVSVSAAESRFDHQLETMAGALQNVKTLHSDAKQTVEELQQRVKQETETNSRTTRDLSRCSHKLRVMQLQRASANITQDFKSMIERATETFNNLESCKKKLGAKPQAPTRPCAPCSERSSEVSTVDRLLDKNGAGNQQQSRRAIQDPPDPQADPTCTEFENAKAPFELGESVESQNKPQSTQIAGGKNFMCGITNFELVCLGERIYGVRCKCKRTRCKTQKKALPVFEGRLSFYTRRQCKRHNRSCRYLCKGGNTWKASPWKGEERIGAGARRRWKQTPTISKSIWSPDEIKQDKYVQVATGDDHMCALGLQGRVRCFQVFHTQIPKYVWQFEKIAKHQGVTKVAAGGATTCVIAAGKLSCHGYLSPKKSPAMGVIIPHSWKRQSFIDVAVAAPGICAIAEDHSVRCRPTCKLRSNKKVCSEVPRRTRPLRKVKVKAAVVFMHKHKKKVTFAACGILLQTGLLECQNDQGQKLEVLGVIKNRKISHLTAQASSICAILSDNSELACTTRPGGLKFTAVKKMGGMTQFRAAAAVTRLKNKPVFCGIGSDNLLHCNPQSFLESTNVALRSRFVQTGDYTDGNQRDMVSELPFIASTPCATTCMGSGIASWACYKPETSCTSCKDNEHLTILDPLARAGTCTAKKCEYCKPRRCCDLRSTSDKIFYHVVAGEQGADSQGVCVNATDSCQANCINTGNKQGASMLCDKGCNKFNVVLSGQMAICTARKHVACQRGKDPDSKTEHCEVDRTVGCRAMCPDKPELWAFGPTCALKAMQAGNNNTNSTVVAEVLRARHHCAVKTTSLIELIQKECTIEGCNSDSCINVARTF